jgi:putative Mg2+ transporter-C (MgtC) family protein
MTNLEFGLRLATGLGCGVAIGLERQWRQRMAGLRTNALVATGACLFVLLSVAMHDASSPDRVAAQVVSGVGFLGGGVILRDGLNLRGINTAATLWCAAAVGCLAGAGLFLYSAAGALAVVLTNLLLRPVARSIDRQPGPAAESDTGYEFRAVCRSADEAHVRALLLQALAGQAFTLRGLHSEDLNGGDRVEVRASLLTQTADQAQLEAAVSRLSLEPGVSAVTWEVVEDGAILGDRDEPSPRRRRRLFRRTGRSLPSH